MKIKTKDASKINCENWFEPYNPFRPVTRNKTSVHVSSKRNRIDDWYKEPNPFKPRSR